MFRKNWDVQDLIGQNARVRLVDENPGNYSWGHINFDDLKGDIDCSPVWGIFLIFFREQVNKLLETEKRRTGIYLKLLLAEKNDHHCHFA